MGPGIPKGTLSAGTEAPSSGPGQHAGCERRPTLERVSRGLTYRGRGRRTPARPTGRRAEPECGGARVEPSRADGPEVGALRFLPGARREGSAPAAAVCCLRLRPGAGGAHGAAAGLRVPEPDGERGAGPAWAEAASFPCALPAPPPRRCRQQSGPGARAGLGRARGRRRFSGCAASVAPPFPGQAAASLRGRSVLGASSAVFAGRAALFIYFSKWVLVTGRKLGNSLGLAQSVERGTLDLRVSSGPLLGVEITRKDQL